MKITSVNNDLVKNVTKLQQRKYRDETGLFLLEGEKCVQEAIEYGINLKYIFVLEGNTDFKYENAIETSESVLSKISSTTNYPKVVAVGEQLHRKWKNEFKNIVLLENIKDAGNLGTIIRSSCAFNVDAIILYGDTVDLYNPKCVRASVGNLWKVPIFNIKNFDELKTMCQSYTPIATLPKNRDSSWLQNFETGDKNLIMFGTESEGLSENLINYAKNKGSSITIEMSNKVESLNLSTSVSIILYELFVK